MSETGTVEAREAHRFLVSLPDPMAELARFHGPVDFMLPSYGSRPPDHLGRLTLTIVGQVISARAATRIFRLLTDRLGGAVTAQGLLDVDEPDLRALGLTRAKAGALRALAAEIVSGGFSFEELELMTDEQAQARLTALPGIGRWSAQMFLLRSLGRPDIFPSGDLGLRRGIALVDGLPSTPSPTQSAERSLAWQPYRSYAAKYLWLRYTTVTSFGG